MDELPVAAAHDSKCLKVPQGYKKHKPKGFNTGNVMIDDQSSSKDINTQTESESESESELFTGDTSKDNHSPGPVFREVSP